MISKVNKWIYFASALLIPSFILSISFAHAEEPTTGCTTVIVKVSGGDWAPSAYYQPCGTPPGTQETWKLTWWSGHTGYTETKDVEPESPFQIGWAGEACYPENCQTFNPTGETYNIECCGCISTIMPGCIPNKINAHCEAGECSTS